MSNLYVHSCGIWRNMSVYLLGEEVSKKDVTIYQLVAEKQNTPLQISATNWYGLMFGQEVYVVCFVFSIAHSCGRNWLPY